MAMKQRRAQPDLKRFDLLTDGSWRHVQLQCRAGKLSLRAAASNTRKALTELFSSEALTTYEKVRRDQSKALAEGTDASVPLYAG